MTVPGHAARTGAPWSVTCGRTSYPCASTNITTVNPLDQTHRTIVDAALRLFWNTNANGEVTKFGYNPAHQLINLIDGKNLGLLNIARPTLLTRSASGVQAHTTH